MALHLPLTIDLKKDQLTNKDYGIEHINKLLEEELAQLKSLKSQKSRDSLPILKAKNDKSGKVEGLMDYKKRVEQSKSRGCQTTRGDKITDHTTCIGPFSEINHDYTRDGRITGKGEVPFFKVNADRSSLTYRLPRLLDSQVPKTANNMSYQFRTPVNQSRKNERTKRASGKLVRTQAKLFKNDFFTSDSEPDDITDSLKVQYCTITARESFEQEIKDKSLKKGSICENKPSKKTFHLACTRNPSKYQPITNEDRECSFCASSVYIHTRGSQTHMLKSRRSSTRKTKTSEKAFLPQIKPEVLVKKEEPKNDCEKCRKRFEQAEQNRTSLAIASSQRKREKSNSLIQKAKSRPTTKEQPVDQPKQKETDPLPVFECTAYMHQDGSLSLLPGAFILHNNDYNVWSRNGKTSSVKTSQQKLVNNSSLPRLVQ